MYLYSIDDKNKKIKNVKELSQEEYEEISQCRRLLFNYEGSQTLIAMVVTNQEDFEKYLIQSLQEYIRVQKEGKFSYVYMNRLRFNANRYLLNYLSSVRTFLDHIETNLKNEYGKNSQEWNKIKKMTNEAYDNMIEYRILYYLRNYAQHCGLPIGNIELISDGSSGERKDKLVVIVDTESLLENDFDWKKDIRQDLENLPRHILINRFIPPMTDKLKDINLEVFKINFPVEDLKNAGRKIGGMIKDIINKGNYPAIGDIEVKDKKKEKISLGFEHFPLRALQHLNILQGTENEFRIKS